MTTMRFGRRSYRNGSLPASMLAEVMPSGRHGTSGRARAYLRKDAADSWNRAIEQIEAETGLQLTVRGWTRTLDEQRTFFLQRYRRGARSPFGDYRKYDGAVYGRVDGAAAAVPGFSNHGWGLAVDVNDFGGVGEFGNGRRGQAFPILAVHGWTETEGRRVDEPWHLVYSPSADRRPARRTSRRRSSARSARTATGTTRKPRRPPTIKQRSRRSAWTALWKEFLEAEGQFSGADGTGFGAPLAEATTAWQKAAGLEPDGVVGPRTWYTSLHGVRTGSKGPAVKIAQRVAGLDGKAVDGVAGSVFATRWRQVQRWLGVDDDASIGDVTVSALIRKA
ncbi:D-alanyl-D-alanine carboxypeptidase-like protein [Isoptericola jiangsuensis]|uniref:D-alanyl-D-alanine carboxypeptidase-like protein n=1 Tax=Isoptericola jiangsuensis TaxID=548579 RepID=A0A2A9EW77_9MICO|nr:peptidoglycan-binding protein [Isoptericola jiangsuensis]PFG43148.1 D-alanyl-D-alanine carboxypeptidase-like protein [Isoptericola jiangsuensis]